MIALISAELLMAELGTICSGLGAAPVAAGLTLVATTGLAYALDRDPTER